MKKTIIIFLIITWVFACSAQNVTVIKIDSVCQNIDKMINDEYLLPHTVSYVVNRPAIGLQKTILYFYYNAMSCEKYDVNPVTDSVEYIVNPVLSKVVIKYNIAASEYVSKEYYYENDKLVYFEWVTNSIYSDDGTDSLRVYYLNAQERKFDKYIYGAPTSITPDDMAAAEDAVSIATEYLVFFKNMNTLEYKLH